MKHYNVTIRETLEVKMKVAANGREEAEQFARDQWKRGEVVLDANHFTQYCSERIIEWYFLF